MMNKWQQRAAYMAYERDMLARGFTKWDILNQLREEHTSMSYENWEIQGLRERLAVKTNEGETLKAKVHDLEAEIDRMDETIKTLMNVKAEFKPTIDPAMRDILRPIVQVLRKLYWDRNCPPQQLVMDELNALYKRCL